MSFKQPWQGDPTPDSDLNSKIQAELDDTLAQEEILWYQKSREKWITMGNRNTQYFHANTIICRRRNKINALKLNDDEWVTDPRGMEHLAVELFSSLYNLPQDEAQFVPLARGGFPALTPDQTDPLVPSLLTLRSDKPLNPWVLLRPLAVMVSKPTSSRLVGLPLGN